MRTLFLLILISTLGLGCRNPDDNRITQMRSDSIDSIRNVKKAQAAWDSLMEEEIKIGFDNTIKNFFETTKYKVEESSDDFQNSLKNYSKDNQKFKLYSDNYYKFSFLIPLNWEIMKEDDEGEMPPTIIRYKGKTSDSIEFEKKISVEVLSEGTVSKEFLANQEDFYKFFYNGDKVRSGITEHGDKYWMDYDLLYEESFDVLYFINIENCKAYFHDYINIRGRVFYPVIYFFDDKHNIIRITSIGDVLDSNEIFSIIKSFKYF